MKIIKLSPEHWDRLLATLPETSKGVFQTDTLGESLWRQFFAFDPMATFVLDDYNRLPELSDFLTMHEQAFCPGFLSYDLGLKIQGVTSRHKPDVPLAIFQAYENWVEYDQGSIVVNTRDPEYIKQIENMIQELIEPQIPQTPLKLENSVNQDDYRRNIKKIHDYIRAGDFYQLNYTQHLKATTSESPRSLFSRMIGKHPAAYAGYFEYEQLTLISLSPELFLRHLQGVLTTEPIKGTRPRGITGDQDESLKLELLNSAKEEAELFMITDLLRNDLGKVCKIGSIQLEAVKGIKKLPKVWHTYSRISGKLAESYQPLDALLSMFPGGSITGCPKKRAMEVIDELEIESRGIYTGSIGYFHPDGEFSFNIAIRTLVQKGAQLSLGTGGGITIDSGWEAEWAELMIKASTFN
ncbi:MAG: anthranilate synthase component I family protein [Candidatus Marinimicrobia bacterium]|nr:anthranilate synthase component I family protein [Candidatus Neomarinimicrobiota bacterium]